MLIDLGGCFSDDRDACYEAVAGQEEIYLEEIEEQVRSVLISDNDSGETRRLSVTGVPGARLQQPLSGEREMKR
jgi:hypothetical protein